MTYSPLAIKRIYVLGDIYSQCNKVNSIPVYMNELSEEPLGFVDESMGKYADAFLFHLPEAVCKDLSRGHFNYAFDFDYSAETESQPRHKRRINLNYIMLIPNRKRE